MGRCAYQVSGDHAVFGPRLSTFERGDFRLHLGPHMSQTDISRLLCHRADQVIGISRPLYPFGLRLCTVVLEDHALHIIAATPLDY